jgi:hypothetical protein
MATYSFESWNGHRLVSYNKNEERAKDTHAFISSLGSHGGREEEAIRWSTRGRRHSRADDEREE